ncbi:hypothetical protein [Marivirga arenosa]|uniref:Uncharacterized protein n=1 Tax=Marivirga arenosa TaxID=3059076 RepID=A0AA49JAD8_9BACT|nr:hypothetical protein [Marivirga sp. BKB1-2]WKK81537.2 hypothetical protein QYS47_04390 [Marivirga sp. BKB1-2]
MAVCERERLVLSNPTHHCWSLQVIMFTIHEYILIEIRPNKVKVTNLKTRESLESGDNLTFSNERLLMTVMDEPQSTLKDLINQLTQSDLIHFRRTIILNPYHPNISEFSEVEKRSFRDMAEFLGARIVRFKFGKEISIKRLGSRYLDKETSP